MFSVVYLNFFKRRKRYENTMFVLQLLKIQLTNV